MVVAIGTFIQGEVGENQYKEPIGILKSLIVETANTTDATNTIPITLADYGITTVLGIMGFKHTTDNSVIATENPTSAVAAGILTLTVPAGTDDDKRVYQIMYI